MAREVKVAKESQVNPINSVRNTTSALRELDWFDMLTTDSSRKREIRQRMAVLEEERRRRQASAPPGGFVGYSAEYRNLEKELMRLNGILGVGENEVIMW